MNDSLPQRAVIGGIVGVVTVTIAGCVLMPGLSVTMVGFGTLVCVSLLGLLQQSHAAKKLDEIQTVNRDTHTLVNSSRGVQLKLNADLSRWKSDQKPDNEEFAADAIAAERLYAEHEAQQAKVDKAKGK